MARASRNDPLKNALSFERPVLELDLKLAGLRKELEALPKADDGEEPAGAAALEAEITRVGDERDAALREMAGGLTMWQRIQLSRHMERPVTADYVERLCTDVVELHGDRTFGDDRAILTALATWEGRRILLVAHRKGRTTEARIACNWGCAHPEGYRKALRCMKLAARLRLPVVTLINTPGAYPGIGAEERGQASAIAWNILEMARLPTPIVSVVIGEGGSGGALGIGVCDRLLVLENSYYSVISPEGCASILWKGQGKEEGRKGASGPPQEAVLAAAEALRLSSDALTHLGVADEILPEPPGGAQRDKDTVAATVGASVSRHLEQLCALPLAELLAARAAKYRHIGRFRLDGLESNGQGPSAAAAAP